MKKFYSVVLSFIVVVIVLFAVSCDNHDMEGEGEIVKRYQVLGGSEETYSLKEIGNIINEISFGIITRDLIDLVYELGILDEDQHRAVLTLFTDENKFGTCVIKYRSTDIDGKEVWLTGRLVYKVDENGDIIQPDHILLSCHYTQTDNMEVPSQMLGLDAILATHGALVVAPDYMGYGIPGEGNIVDHPYCVPSITAVHCLDMVRAAKEYLSSMDMETDDLKLYNQGYSQGGISSLAVARYIQEHNLQSEFKLANTFCGAGPYSIKAMQQDFIKEGAMYYPVVYPLMVIGMKKAFPDILTENLEDYFAPEAIEAKIIEKVKAKNEFIFVLNDEIIEALDGDPDEGPLDISKIMNKEVSTPGAKLYNQALKAAELCEMASGWNPESYVHFVHGRNDDIVPYFNFELAEKGLKNEKTFFETYELLSTHAANAGLFYMQSFLGEYKNIYDSDGNIINSN